MAKTVPSAEIGHCLQVVALPWRVAADGSVDILLVTSRTNGKWMLPKGWPMPGKSDAAAALQEAKEEAGVDGVVSAAPIGSYHFIKLLADGSTKPSQGVIYPMRVTTELTKWDEKGERRRKWVSARKASKMVFEADLSRFLANLAAGRPALPAFSIGS